MLSRNLYLSRLNFKKTYDTSKKKSGACNEESVEENLPSAIKRRNEIMQRVGKHLTPLRNNMFNCPLLHIKISERTREKVDEAGDAFAQHREDNLDPKNRFYH